MSETIQNTPRFGTWTPVVETRPKAAVNRRIPVLAFFDGEVEPAIYANYEDGEEWTDWNHISIDPPDAWMPMPPAYKPPAEGDSR